MSGWTRPFGFRKAVSDLPFQILTPYLVLAKFLCLWWYWYFLFYSGPEIVVREHPSPGQSRRRGLKGSLGIPADPVLNSHTTGFLGINKLILTTCKTGKETRVMKPVSQFLCRSDLALHCYGSRALRQGLYLSLGFKC